MSGAWTECLLLTNQWWEVISLSALHHFCWTLAQQSFPFVYAAAGHGILWNWGFLLSLGFFVYIRIDLSFMCVCWQFPLCNCVDLVLIFSKRLLASMGLSVVICSYVVRLLTCVTAIIIKAMHVVQLKLSWFLSFFLFVLLGREREREGGGGGGGGRGGRRQKREKSRAGLTPVNARGWKAPSIQL